MRPTNERAIELAIAALYKALTTEQQETAVSFLFSCDAQTDVQSNAHDLLRGRDVDK